MVKTMDDIKKIDDEKMDFRQLLRGTKRVEKQNENKKDDGEKSKNLKIKINNIVQNLI